MPWGGGSETEAKLPSSLDLNEFCEWSEVCVKIGQFAEAEARNESMTSETAH